MASFFRNFSRKYHNTPIEGKIFLGYLGGMITYNIIMSYNDGKKALIDYRKYVDKDKHEIKGYSEFIKNVKGYKYNSYSTSNYDNYICKIFNIEEGIHLYEKFSKISYYVELSKKNNEIEAIKYGMTLYTFDHFFNSFIWFIPSNIISNIFSNFISFINKSD